MENNEVPQSEEAADNLLNEIESASPGREPVQDAPVQQTPQAPVDEFSFTVGGKEIKANRDKVIRWAQMGYDAPTKLGQLTKELESWKQKESTFKQMQEKYGAVDEYVRQNPQFWDHVLKQYEQRTQMMNDPANPLAQTVSQLQAQMQELQQYKQSIEEQQKSARIQQEDQAYMKEFEAVKTAYPQVDFVTPDESGKSLEYKVLEYATQNGITKFTTAFRDFYHDELMKMREEQGKEKVVKDKQGNKIKGILGISSQPTRKTSDDVKGKSYGDLANEIIAELKLN